MAIANIQNINIGLPNESVGSDSLYTAFNKTQNNFTTLFSCASPYNTFVGGKGIATSASANSITITNTGVNSLSAGTNIILSGSNGDITISSTGGGGGGGGTVTSVALTPVSSNRLTVTNSPIVSSGSISIDLAQSGVVAGSYNNPTLSVDTFGRVTSAANGSSIANVNVLPGNGIAVTNSSVGANYQFTVINTGVTSIAAGTGIQITGNGTGRVTLSALSGAGTVTYVGVNSSTLSVSGSPISTTGTITINLPQSFAVSGNITAGNLKVNNFSNLGNVGNVYIGGGSSGQVLKTDGAGNLAWTSTPLAVTEIQHGASNVTIPTASSNVYINANSGSDQQWVFDTTGNLTLPDAGILWNNGGLTTLQAGTDGAQIGSNDGQSYVIANANGTYMQTLADTTNSIWHFGTDGNLTTPGSIITASGSGGDVTGANNITANYFFGNVTGANNITANYFFGNGGNITGIIASLNITNFGADPTGVADSTTAIQNAINAGIAQSRPVYIPSGTYKTTSTITIDFNSANYGGVSFKIYGDGGTSVIAPTSFAAPVISINQAVNWVDALFQIENFSINAAVTTDYTGLTVGQYGFYFTPIPNGGDAGVEIFNVGVYYCDVGFYCLSNQFCTYKNVRASRCNVGFYLTTYPGSSYGGGNSSTFYDTFITFCQVGMLLAKNSPYPMGNNTFINLVINQCAVCAFYANGVGTLFIQNFPPEGNGFEWNGTTPGPSTYSFSGVSGTIVVPKSTVCLTNGSGAYFNGYADISAATLHFYVTDNSWATVDMATAGNGFTPTVDETSLLTFGDVPTTFRGGNQTGVLGNAPRWFPGGDEFTIVTIPNITEAPWLTNDALGVAGPNVDYGYTSGGPAGYTSTYVVDPQMGYVSQLSYANTYTNGVYSATLVSSSDYTGVGTAIACSFLVKSSSSTATWVVDYAQSTVQTTFTLPANTWCRVALYGQLAYTPRLPYLLIGTTNSAGVSATLNICKIQSLTSPSTNILQSFFRDGLYNPGLRITPRYVLPAIPTVGTWSVGDIVYQTTPTVNGSIGWVCTTAGTPGTWVAFGGVGAGNDSLNIVNFGADPTGSADSTTFIQTAIDTALSTGVPVYIPSGTFKTTASLTINLTSGSFKIFGDGGTSIIAPTSFGTPVLTIQPNDNYQIDSFVIQDFSITAGSITSGQHGIYSSYSAAGHTGVQIRNVQVNNCDVGFYLVDNSYCTFQNISAANGNVGMYLTSVSPYIGGYNNTFDGCWFTYNQVGIIVASTETFGPQSVRFINPSTNNNAISNFYIENSLNVNIESWSPGPNTSSTPTYTFVGYSETITVPNSLFCASTGSLVSIRNLSIDETTESFIVQTNSTVSIDMGTSGVFIPKVDSTSLLTFSDSPSGFNITTTTTSGVLGNAPRWIPTASSFNIVVSPMVTQAPWLTNDAYSYAGPNVDYGYTNGGPAGYTSTYVVDPQLGYVNQLSYADTTANGVYSATSVASSDYTGIGTAVACSLLVKSSSSTANWSIDFAQSTVVAYFSLPADTWCRVVLYGQLVATPRSPYLLIGATNSAGVAATLNICKIHSLTNPSPNDLQSFIRNGLYNPGQGVTTHYQLSAAPAVGTWTVGSIVYNTAPTAGGYLGWVCTTAGTPGTWNTFGAISA